jgi:predicted nucleotidyltransferase
MEGDAPPGVTAPAPGATRKRPIASIARDGHSAYPPVTSRHDSPGDALAQIVRVLHSHGITDFALTGGVAVGVWSEPRQTRDVDVCGVLPIEEVDRLLALRDGTRAGHGALPDMVRFTVGNWDVDLFVCQDAYDRACLERAVTASVDGVEVRVVTAEDLLIHKLIKLRTDRRRLLQDLADVRAIVTARANELDWPYLQTWLPTAEAELLESFAVTDDETLVKRLLQGTSTGG